MTVTLEELFQIGSRKGNKHIQLFAVLKQMNAFMLHKHIFVYGCVICMRCMRVCGCECECRIF